MNIQVVILLSKFRDAYKRSMYVTRRLCTSADITARSIAARDPWAKQLGRSGEHFSPSNGAATHIQHTRLSSPAGVSVSKARVKGRSGGVRTCLNQKNQRARKTAAGVATFIGSAKTTFSIFFLWSCSRKGTAPSPPADPVFPQPGR